MASRLDGIFTINDEAWQILLKRVVSNNTLFHGLLKAGVDGLQEDPPSRQAAISGSTRPEYNHRPPHLYREGEAISGKGSRQSKGVIISS